jgi:hypothetical protein
MSAFDDDLAEAMADMADMGLGEPALWTPGGTGTPVPCTVVIDEMADTEATDHAGVDNVRIADITVPLAVVVDPKRDDHVTLTDAASPYQGEWVVLGIEVRTRTHRVLRCRRALRERSGDGNAREIRR